MAMKSFCLFVLFKPCSVAIVTLLLYCVFNVCSNVREPNNMNSDVLIQYPQYFRGGGGIHIFWVISLGFLITFHSGQFF